MKIINSKSFIGFLMCFLIFSTGCDDLFEDINTNENDPEDVTLDVLLTAAETGLMDNFGFGFDRYSNAFTQHFSGNHATGVDMDQYILLAGDFNFYFEEMYRGGLQDCAKIVEKGTAEESWHYVGIAQVMQTIGLGYLTSLYGDIPWSEALQGNDKPYPKYDTQEQIYTEMQNLLAGALENFNKGSVAKPGSDDVVFSGDMDKWKAIANVLRARFHNHLSKVNPSGSATSALAAIDAAMAAGMSTAGDLHYNYEGTVNHLNPWYDLYTNNLIIASENFMTWLQDTSDPRLTAYWDDVAVDGTYVGYTGKCTGYGITNQSFSPVGPNGYFGKENSPMLICTYFEAKFIEAEAALRAGNADRAATAHNEGVAASINKTATGYGTQDEIDAYLAAYAAEDASSITLEKIMDEKYKAMFTQGIEGWVDARRHDYAYPEYLDIPKLGCTTPVGGEFVRRALYPQSELNDNPDQVPSAGIYDRLWWDK